MKAFAVILVIAFLATAANGLSVERMNALRDAASNEAHAVLQTMSMQSNAISVWKALEQELLEKVASGVKDLHCSPKLSVSDVNQYFQKGDNQGQGVTKFQDWVPKGATVASVFLEANAAAAAGLGVSVGVGLALEFAVEFENNIPKFKDAAVSLCANWDVSIGVQFGANAGGAVYLVFGPIERFNDANCGFGVEVFAAIGGGIQIMLKCPDNDAAINAVKTAWNNIKNGWSGDKAVPAAADNATKLSFTEKLKQVAKSGAQFAGAHIIGVAFSAGVGAGGIPVSASYSIADLVKKAVPKAWGEIKSWAEGASDKIKAAWTSLKNFVSRK